MNQNPGPVGGMFAFVLAASLASTIGGLPFNSLPVMLGSMADSFSLEPQVVGMIGSICFAGYLVGTLGAPFWSDLPNKVQAYGTRQCVESRAAGQTAPPQSRTQAALIARANPTGRAVVLIPAVFALSSMVGPGVGGQLIAGSSVSAVLALAAVCSVLPAVLYQFWQPQQSAQ